MFDQVVRTSYFEPDLSDLIVEAAYPAIRAVQSRSAARGFVRTHWARGPHVDCVIDAEAGDRAVLEAARDRIAEWVARHPSRTPLPADYLLQSQRMAQAEQWSGAIAPCYDNNCVFLTGNERKALWSSERLGSAAADFHCDTIDDVVSLIGEKRRSRGAFLLAAARRLAAIGRVAPGGEFGFWPISLSAHARLFLIAHPSMRPTFESAWDRLRETAIDSLGEILRSAVPPADVANWMAAARSLDSRLRALLASPGEAILPVEVDNPLHIQDAIGPGAAAAPRLREMLDAGPIAAAFDTPVHHRFRIIVNLFYESLATATISPVERALACYLLTKVVLEDHPDAASAARETMIELAGTSGV